MSTFTIAVRPRVMLRPVIRKQEIFNQEYMGRPGPSAYEVWLEAGNVGSRDDFLASLVGEPGPQGEPGLGEWTAPVSSYPEKTDLTDNDLGILEDSEIATPKTKKHFKLSSLKTYLQNAFSSIFAGTNDSRLSNTRTPTDASVTVAKLANELKAITTASGTAIDWSLGIQVDLTLTGTTTLAFSNLQAGKTVSLLVNGNYSIGFPAYCTVVGSYSGTKYNLIQMYCAKSTSGSEKVAVTIFNLNA